MENSNDVINIIYSVIEKLYIYCHLKSNSDETQEEIEEDMKFDTAIMIIIICILSFTILKMLVVFIYFFIINTMINLAKFLFRLIRKKFCLNIIDEIKFASFHLVKILKKFYTNNFYSYENKTFGAFFVTSYLLFILFNLIFTFDHAVIGNNDHVLRILLIISFELNIFSELVCCTFFLVRNFKKQFILIIILFVFLNILILPIIIYRIINNLNEEEFFDISIVITRLIFLTFFSILGIYSIKVISDYDLNSMIVYLFA